MITFVCMHMTERFPSNLPSFTSSFSTLALGIGTKPFDMPCYNTSFYKYKL